MNSSSPRLDDSFIEKQRRYLSRLRTALRAAALGDENDEAQITSEGVDGAREYEDEAQRLAMREVQEHLLVRDSARLERVTRALKKIDEGTYGFSDASGKPISRERLEAVPEAVLTIDEERAREQKR
jgi:DnaK suppressor protein